MNIIPVSVEFAKHSKIDQKWSICKEEITKDELNRSAQQRGAVQFFLRGTNPVKRQVIRLSGVAVPQYRQARREVAEPAFSQTR